MRKSLTLRLTLFFGVVSTAVLIAIGYLVGAAVERHFADEDRMELQAKRDLIAHVLMRFRSVDELDSLSPRMDDALVGHDSLTIRIASPEGKPLFVTAGAEFPATVLAARSAGESTDAATLLSWEWNGHLYRGMVTNVPTTIAGVPNAAVALALKIDHHREFMNAFYKSLWLAIAIGILVTGLLGWVAARRGIEPVRSMAQVAHNITASRLDDRLALDTLPVELVDLADAFNAMLSRLEDSFRRLSEFSSDIAHELRTPISNLLTQTQVALSRSRSADEYRDVLYSNVEEFERLARMIADMLFLAKADNGLIVPRSETVDLASEVRDLFDYYDALVEERGVQLEVSGEGSVRGERLMIRRAISNLLSNAVNHTARDGRVHVRIDRADNGEIRLAVENRGETIAAEHLPRLFDRFYRVDPARQRLSEGAGLGLAITKSIVAAHRGIVRAFSADGLTRIEILFPSPATH